LKVLLDESVPYLVKTRLAGLSIKTVPEMGWSGLKNGDLLALAEKQFEVFVSSDQKLPYQQNLSRYRLGVVILASNQVPIVETMLPAIEAAITSVQPGTFLKEAVPSVF
jgi:hypothetical protein